MRGKAAVMEPLALLLAGALATADCPPAAMGDDAAEAADAYVAGVEHVAAERWAEAERSFLEALARDSGIPLAHYGVGQARMALKRYPEAALAFESSRHAFQCAGALSAEARLASQARLDATLQTLRDARRDLDEDRLTRQMILWQELNGDEKPRPGEAAKTRDALQTQLERLERLKARRSGGPPPELLLALGSALFHSGDLSGAEREFRGALVGDPGSGDAYNNLAVVLMLGGRLDEAERAVEAAEERGVAVAPRLKEELRKRRSARPR